MSAALLNKEFSLKLKEVLKCLINVEVNDNNKGMMFKISLLR